MTGTTVLYRPVGQRELDSIIAAGYRGFPPRLAHQPIFYPVLSESYATQIAREWNTADEASGFVGYVTRFAVDTAFVARYAIRTVGASEHKELWIPAEDLETFNDHIVGRIEVVARFAGR